MDGVYAAPAPHVASHVLADAYHAIHTPQCFGPLRVHARAFRTKRNGDGRADQMRDARARRPHGDVEEQLGRVVGRGDDHVRIEFRNLSGEELSQMRIESERANVDAVQAETDLRRRDMRLDTPRFEAAEELLVRLLAKAFDARHHTDIVPAGG